MMIHPEDKGLSNEAIADLVEAWHRKKYPRKVRRSIWKRLRVLWLLWCVSRKYPSQRFGQIVVNYCGRYHDPGGPLLFHTEDWLMIQRLKQEIHREIH